MSCRSGLRIRRSSGRSKLKSHTLTLSSPPPPPQQHDIVCYIRNNAPSQMPWAACHFHGNSMTALPQQHLLPHWHTSFLIQTHTDNVSFAHIHSLCHTHILLTMPFPQNALMHSLTLTMSRVHTNAKSKSQTAKLVVDETHFSQCHSHKMHACIPSHLQCHVYTQVGRQNRKPQARSKRRRDGPRTRRTRRHIQRASTNPPHDPSPPPHCERKSRIPRPSSNRK